MTPSQILHTAVKTFSSPAQLVPYERFLTKQGISYIVADYENARPFECAVHIDRNTRVLYGKQTYFNVDIDSMLPIEFDTHFVDYDSHKIFIRGYEGYNKQTQHYRYLAGIPTSDKHRLLSELSGVWGNSCFDIISQMPYTILPPQVDTTSLVGNAIVMEIDSQETAEMLKDDLENITENYYTRQIESLRFVLLGFTRFDGLKFAKSLQDFSISSGKFGFIELPQVKEINDTDYSAGLKSVLTEVTCRVNYILYAEGEEQKANKIITKAYFKMKAIGGNLDAPQTD